MEDQSGSLQMEKLHEYDFRSVPWFQMRGSYSCVEIFDLSISISIVLKKYLYIQFLPKEKKKKLKLVKIMGEIKALVRYQKSDRLEIFHLP